MVRASATVLNCPQCGNQFRRRYVSVSVLNEVRDALAELVALKDGPRDEDYERRKPLAWEAARKALRDA